MIDKKEIATLFKDSNIVALWTDGQGRLVVGVESLKKVTQALRDMNTPIEEVGLIEALQERTDKWRPAPGGVSIGHYAITAGTLGGIVLKDGIRMILSNNHILAASNNGRKGDEIYQPGPADQNGNGNGPPIPPCPFARTYAAPGNFLAKIWGSKTRLRPVQENEYLIAHLEQFIPIDFQGGYNKVDCALAKPIDDSVVLDEILEIGLVKSFATAGIGDAVRKSGRTTGLTQGTVTAIDGVVRVSYGGGLEAIFENQIITGNMSSGGDSGSWLVKDLSFAGLLFAGSNQITIHNQASDVKEALEIEL
jgi:hypothetical protein